MAPRILDEERKGEAGRPTPDESDQREEAGGESLAPLICEERLDEVLADRPQAAEVFVEWLLGLKDELESGGEGSVRAVEDLRTAIQRVEGLSSKHISRRPFNGVQGDQVYGSFSESSLLISSPK